MFSPSATLQVGLYVLHTETSPRMFPLAERLYVAALVSVNLTFGGLLYLVGSPIFGGMLCVLGFTVAVGRIVPMPAEHRQSTADSLSE